jgi:hypothetical protein
MVFRSILTGFIFMFVLAGPCSADIVILADGEFLVGSVEKTPEGVLFRNDGKGPPRVLTDVVGVEQDPQSLKGTKLKIILADQSVIRGRLADWEDGLGVFIDTPAGTIRLSSETILQIFLEKDEPPREPAVAVELGGMVLRPFEADRFGLSWAPLIAVETSLPGSDVVSVGLSCDSVFLNYLPSSEVTYNVLDFSLTVNAKLIPLFSKTTARSFLSPYLKAGVGGAFVMVTDNRKNSQSKNYGTLDFQSRLECGVDIPLSSQFSLESSLSASAILQDPGLFWLGGLGLSVRYGF